MWILLCLVLLLCACSNAPSGLERALNEPMRTYPRFAEVLKREPVGAVTPRRVSFEQVEYENTLVNAAITYCSDPTCAGLVDEWLTPQELTQRGWRGDCEEYAIAKYYRLRALGMRANDLRILVVEPASGPLHAVLAAQIRGAWYVLDNSHDAVLPATTITRYRGMLHFNEESVAAVRTEAE